MDPLAGFSRPRSRRCSVQRAAAHLVGRNEAACGGDCGRADIGRRRLNLVAAKLAWARLCNWSQCVGVDMILIALDCIGHHHSISRRRGLDFWDNKRRVREAVGGALCACVPALHRHHQLLSVVHLAGAVVVAVDHGARR